jgi:hypothetical protein
VSRLGELIEFGEPIPEHEPKPRGKAKPNGWQKVAQTTWKARERAVRAKKRPRTRGFSPPETHPCPRCYAPIRDGVCSGYWCSKERLGA